MVKLITKFKRNQGGLSGKTITSNFKSTALAKKHRRFLVGTYVSSVIVLKRKQKRR